MGTQAKTPLNASQLLSAAQLAAERAATFIRGQEGRFAPDQWTLKAPADFVTEVDREAERMITADLTTAFPGSAVLGEELTPGSLSDVRRTTHDSVVWIVDPLDGTTNFLHRFPFYSVSIAAACDGELVAGAVHDVPHDVRYGATKGGGAFENGRPIRVSAIADPKHALIGTGIPFKDQSQMPLYQRHLAAVSAGTAGVRRPGSAALDLCWVASGRFDGFWEIELSPWDVAAGVLMIREAGGVVTGFDGERDVVRRGPLVTGNPAIHAWLMETLKQAGNGEHGSTR